MSTPILPGAIRVPGCGLMTATLGHCETEATAALVIRYHQARGLNDWTPVTPRQLAELFDAPDPLVAEWARNPFWRPDPPSVLVAGGWVTGWSNFDDPGTVTPKFIEAMRRWAV